MKVLLVYPNLHGMNMLPYAISIFVPLLGERGHEVALFDTTNWRFPEEEFDSDKEKSRTLTARPFDSSKLDAALHDGDVFEAFRQKLNTFHPDLIAFSVTEDLYPLSLQLLDCLREIDLPVIMGGVFPTFAPQKCLAHPAVDMVCIGEGEPVLPVLCDRIAASQDYSDLPGLWVKTSAGIQQNPLPAPADINKNPLPELSLFDESRLYRPMQGQVWRMLPVETHRGCPYNCAYCNSPSLNQLYQDQCNTRFFRKKSMEALQRELHYYRDEIKAEALYFWADTFMAYNSREFDMFCEIYKDIRLPFYCQARPEEIHAERVQRLMDLGLFRMALGVEHGNEEFRRKLLQRTVTNERMLEAFAVLEKLGLPFSVNNIIGFPTETRELAMDTIELNRQIAADSMNAYSYSPFHGTPLRKMAEALGYCGKDLIARSITRPTTLNMPQFPSQEIEGLRRCFVLYVKMPRHMWGMIEKAEKRTKEGDAMFEQLKQECMETYYPEWRK